MFFFAKWRSPCQNLPSIPSVAILEESKITCFLPDVKALQAHVCLPPNKWWLCQPEPQELFATELRHVLGTPCLHPLNSFIWKLLLKVLSVQRAPHKGVFFCCCWFLFYLFIFCLPKAKKAANQCKYKLSVGGRSGNRGDLCNIKERAFFTTSQVSAANYQVFC